MTRGRKEGVCFAAIVAGLGLVTLSASWPLIVAGMLVGVAGGVGLCLVWGGR